MSLCSVNERRTPSKQLQYHLSGHDKPFKTEKSHIRPSKYRFYSCLSDSELNSLHFVNVDRTLSLFVTFY